MPDHRHARLSRRHVQRLCGLPQHPPAARCNPPSIGKSGYRRVSTQHGRVKGRWSIQFFLGRVQRAGHCALSNCNWCCILHFLVGLAAVGARTACIPVPASSRPFTDRPHSHHDIVTPHPTQQQSRGSQRQTQNQIETNACH